MAITDFFDRVTDSATGRPVISALANPGKAIAAASVTITDATNWTTTTPIHFSIYTLNGQGYKDPTTQTDWKGQLTGTTITNLQLKGGVDRAYTAGAIIELTPHAGYFKDLVDALRTFFNDDATIKANVINTANIANSAITNAKLSTAAGEVGAAWVDYSATTTITGFSTITDKFMRYKIIGKIIYIDYAVQGTSNAATLTMTLPFAQLPRSGGTNQFGIETASGLAIDNGAVQASPNRAYTDPSSSNTILKIDKNAAAAWTASGTKSARGQLFYEIA